MMVNRILKLIEILTGIEDVLGCRLLETAIRCAGMANLSDLVGFASTFAIRYQIPAGATLKAGMIKWRNDGTAENHPKS